MRASRFFISTLKEAPSDAEIVSHQLMMRAGMIKRLGSGIYTYMPMGLKVIRKVEAIVREEMNKAGAIELLMPLVQPAELWQETGRWDKMGPELLRVKDRHGRDCAQRDQILPPDSVEFLPHPDQVPRRAPSALWLDARPRIHHEGRLFLRPRPGRHAKVVSDHV
jgi:hypothetical protein